MPDYRRAYTPGGAIILTLVTFNRQLIFAEPNNVKRLRWAVATVKAVMPFDLQPPLYFPTTSIYLHNNPVKQGRKQ